MKNRNLSILFFTLIVVMLGFGIVIPLLPFLVERFGGNGTSMGFLMAIYSVMQFIFSPIWGGLSDRFGRKPVLMLGILGNALTQVMFGLSGSLTMLFVARGLAGILSSATLPTAMAYISDSTDEHNRGGGMGIVGAAMGVGMVLGPGLGGLMGKYSLSAPFFFASGVSIIAMILVGVFLPESLHVDQRATGQVKFQGPQLREMARALTTPIGFLLVLALLHNFALANFEGIFGMYAQLRYNYDEATVGLILTVVGIVSAIAQGALTGWATKRWGDAAVIKGSLLASIFGFLLMLVAQNLAMVILMTGLFVFSNAMLRPGVSALISKRTPYEQGMAMGLNNSYMSLGRIIGPLWAGAALDLNLSFPYLTGAAIMLIGFVASLYYLPHKEKTDKPVLANAD
jgi:DHA1 family multidrug resistance protein-like MFS transporter